MQNLAQRRAATLTRVAEPERDVYPSPDSGPASRTAELPQSRIESRGHTDSRTRDRSVVSTLCRQLSAWGVEEAFGVSGGAIALLFDALAESDIHLRHFRHESGAAFAACEGYFASGQPTVVYATTGPGLLNTLTGITAARWEGAKVILLSGHTNSAQRGRWATQETSSYTLPQDALYSKGQIFDFALRLESTSELPSALRRVATGLARPGGFVAHLCLPMSVQSGHVQMQPTALARSFTPTVDEQSITEIASLLRREPFVIWAGFGARGAASQLRELAERSGAKVICSPRAKGTFSERHPQYLGVSGIGGHDAVIDYMVQEKPRRTLVLGTRLSEATSFWDRDLLPSESMIHVDLDPDVPGTAFPDFPVLGVQSDIASFLDALLAHFPRHPKNRSLTKPMPFDDALPIRLSRHGIQDHHGVTGRASVRPQVLMQTIQDLVIDGSDALVMAECGNAFAWCNHFLRFERPSRYRVSTLFGSMGHTASGVVGAALATDRTAVAVVGDGSMLMNSEVSTAAQYRAKAIWIVLNDSGYGMCRDGQRTLGVSTDEMTIPQVDFVEWARSLGADGARVEREEMLDVAILEALDANGPFVIDVHIDTREASPLLKRFESLIQQGSSKNVAGWERS